MGDETGHIIDPNQPIRSIGEDIRDLAYEKLADECIYLFQGGINANEATDGIEYDSKSGIATVGAGDSCVIIEFDPDDPPGTFDKPQVVDCFEELKLFDYIPDKLDRYSQKGIVYGDRINNILGEVIGQGYPDQSQLLGQYNSEIDSATEHWYGNAADSFSSFFVKPFPVAISNHFDLLSELHAAVESHKNIKLQADQSIRQIAEDTRSALWNYPKKVDPWSVLIPIIGAAIAISSMVVTAGTSAVLTGTALAMEAAEGGAIVTSLLTAVFETAKTGKDVTAAYSQIDCTSVAEIIASMDAATADLSERIYEECLSTQQHLLKTISALDVALKSHPDSRRFIIPTRPGIVDNPPDLDDFGVPGQ